MKIAIPDWQGRISPVFDVAGHLLVAEIGAGCVKERFTVSLMTQDIQDRARQVADLEVSTLVCAAISWPLERALNVAGVEVVPHVCGDVECVLAAYESGQFNKEAFLMPGCCRRRRAQCDVPHRARRNGRKNRR